MTIKKLAKLIEADNIAKTLDEQQLSVIGTDIIELVDKDEASRDKWMKQSKEAMKLALQVVDKDAELGKANIKYPQLTTAALQFHARAYPALVQGNQVVKGQITGEDPQGMKSASADRMSEYMNWHLLEEQEDWNEEFDKILLALPIEGCEFKKTYFNPVKGHNVSEWVRPENLIVHNKTRSLDTCPRVTHKLKFYPQEIIERQRNGVWLDVDLDIDTEDTRDETQQVFYESHCLLDLDDDGYKEPYYVTVHKDSEKVVRIKARYDIKDVKMNKSKVAKIEPFRHFTKYAFIPSPDGSFYDIGFGQLVGPLSKTIDTTLNQMVDAGSLSNLSGGFYKKGVSIDGKQGPIKFKIGEFKPVDVPAGGSIRDAIHQLQFPGPSAVSFNMLGLLLEAVNDITSVQDVMTGKQDNPQEPMGTTLARMEQGMQVFVAIYKRVYRALRKELKKLRALDAVYLEDKKYFRVLDTGEEAQIQRNDFKNDETDVQLVADPSLITNMQRVAKAQALLPFAEDPDIQGIEVKRRYFEAMQVNDVQRLFVPPEDKKPSQAEQLQLAELQGKVNKLESETVKNLAASEKMKAEIGEIMAGIQATFKKLDIEKIKTLFDVIEKIIPEESKELLEESDEPSGTRAMEN